MASFIHVDLSGTPVVEAHTTLQLSRLNDVLRIIIDRLNTHETRLDDCRRELHVAGDRCAALEQEMAQISPDLERFRAAESALGGIQERLERQQAHLTAAMAELTQRWGVRIDECESALRTEVASRQASFDAVDQRTAAAANVARDAHSRLDAIRLPDLAPLQKALDALYASHEGDREKIESSAMFLNLWGASATAMRGVLSDADTAAEPSEAQAIKAAYIQGLPPLVTLDGNLRLLVTGTADALAAQLTDIRLALSSKPDRAEVAGLSEELQTHAKRAQAALESAERRLKAVEGLGLRVAEVEGAVVSLRHSKVDLSSLTLKADEASLQQLTAVVSDLRDDVDGIVARLQLPGNKPLTMKPSGMGASNAVAEAALVSQQPAAAGRRSSVTAISAIEESLGKRLAALSAECARLEQSKADRDTVSKLQEALERALAVMNRQRNTSRSNDRVVAMTAQPNADPPSPPGSSVAAVLSPAAPSAPPPGLEKRPPRQAPSSRPGSSRRSPPPDSATVPRRSDGVRPTVTPVTERPDFGLAGAPSNNTWHVARGSVSVRDVSGRSTPVLIAAPSHPTAAWIEGPPSPDARVGLD